jgi:tRNA threonylcarbamoyladenosine modification (KEOPS) complex  Pcc1 subunit
LQFDGVITLTFRDASTARAVFEATRVDNPARGLTQRVRGNSLELRVAPATSRSLRATLDDWLRCASAAAEAAHRAR